MLKVKPVVMINHETGHVELTGLVRTRQAMLRMQEKNFFDVVGPGKELHIAVLHGNALHEAEHSAEHFRKEHIPVELLINITFLFWGINNGTGALALCGYVEG